MNFNLEEYKISTIMYIKGDIISIIQTVNKYLHVAKTVVDLVREKGYCYLNVFATS